jgi:hypothetical protein
MIAKSRCPFAAEAATKRSALRLLVPDTTGHDVVAY